MPLPYRLGLTLVCFALTVGACENGAWGAPRKGRAPAAAKKPALPRNLGQALINAVQARDPARVKQLLAAGAPVEAVDRDGCTPLMFALWSGQTEIVEALLKRKQDLDWRADDGRTAMSVAFSAARFDPRMPRLLLDRGAGVDAPGSAGRRPLHFAAGWGDVELVQRLLKAGAKPDPKDDLGQTPLMVALAGLPLESQTPELAFNAPAEIRDRWLEAARLLVKAGADVNAADGKGRAAHYYARCRQHASEDARFLELITAAGATRPAPSLRAALEFADVEELRQAVKAGADLNAPLGEEEPAPLFHALLDDKPEILAALLEAGADPNRPDARGLLPLGYALTAESAPLLKTLLEGGADPNRGGTPALRDAVGSDSAELVRTILTHSKVKVDVNRGNEDGETALFAVQSPEVAALLIEHGADVNARSEAGGTPLFIATSPEVIALLVKHGADVNARDKEGSTPLIEHAATFFQDPLPATKALLSLKADPNLANQHGVTPLAVAVRANQVKLADLLLRSGARPDPRTREGHTPLFEAAAEGRLELVRLLLKHKANPRAKVGAETPISIARKQGHGAVAKLLTASGR